MDDHMYEAGGGQGAPVGGASQQDGGAGGHAALTQLQLMERLGTLPTKLAQQPWSAPSVVTQLTPERLQVAIRLWPSLDSMAKVRLLLACLLLPPSELESVRPEVTDLVTSTHTKDDDWVRLMQAAVGDCNGRLDLEGIMSGPGALEAVRATLSSLWQGLDTALGSGAQATPHDFAPLQEVLLHPRVLPPHDPPPPVVLPFNPREVLQGSMAGLGLEPAQLYTAIAQGGAAVQDMGAARAGRLGRGGGRGGTGMLGGRHPGGGAAGRGHDPAGVAAALAGLGRGGIGPRGAAPAGSGGAGDHASAASRVTAGAGAGLGAAGRGGAGAPTAASRQGQHEHQHQQEEAGVLQHAGIEAQQYVAAQAITGGPQQSVPSTADDEGIEWEEQEGIQHHQHPPHHQQHTSQRRHAPAAAPHSAPVSSHPVAGSSQPAAAGFHLEDEEDKSAAGYGVGHAAVQQGYHGDGGTGAPPGAVHSGAMGGGTGLEDEDDDEGPVQVSRAKRQRRAVIVEDEDEDVEEI